jgi:4-hydroxybenzoate polyprenyltransferase
MEDMEGDRKEGCRTMPLQWGLPAAKVFTGVWMVVLTAALIIMQVYVIQFSWWFFSIYIVLLVVIPLIHIFKKFLLAKQIHHFSYLSKMLKWTMLTGIISMVFFLLYTR